MPTDVVMPQMGESVAEGTIVRWLKKVGDAVERDEPLFEISTDKVDAEIPSPAAGVITEIRHSEGETVEINTVVAVIGQAGEQPAAAAAPKKAAPAPKQSPSSTAPLATPVAASSPAASAASSTAAAPPSPRMMPVALAARAAAPASSAPAVPAPFHRSSPLVRKIAKEHQVDIAEITGTGISGRVTKQDILSFLSGATPGTRSRGGAARAATPTKPGPVAPTGPATGAGLAGQSVPMSVMRKKIAEHMMASRRTSAHVHSLFEVNFHTVDQIRKANKAKYEAHGAKLTFLSFIIKAAAEALKAVPVVNASVVGENIVYHKDINIGVAVALDWGLIVPVVKNADQKSLLEISSTVSDLANRARSKHLKTEEVAGGTFTITNPGTFGALVGMPIINQPQVAILGIGSIDKRVVVVDDAIAIRPVGLLSLGFDHRIIDGAVADSWLKFVKDTLEAWDPANV